MTASFVPALDFSAQFVGAPFDVLEVQSSNGFPGLVINGWLSGNVIDVQAIVFRIELSIATMFLSLERHDVVAAFPERDIPLHCGFAGTFSTVGFGEKFRIEVDAIVSNPDSNDQFHFPIGHIVGEQERYFSVCRTPRKLDPILVTANGRSGSTYMMRLLAAHPDIVSPKSYPLEVRHATYCIKTMKVLTEQCLDLGEDEGERLRDIDRGVSRTGPNPYTHPDLVGRLASPKAALALCQEIREIYGAAALKAVDAVYSAIADDQGKTSARYFAEKMRPSFIPDAMHEVYGESAKEIILIRDPRDTHASAHAFNTLRGIPGFGSANARDESDWLSIRKALFSNVMDGWRRRRDRALLVRYEDLITEPETVLPEIFDYLGLRLPDDLIDGLLAEANAVVTEFSEHRTSESSLSSIGRWRRDLSPEQARLAGELMRDDLLEAGYSIDVGNTT